MTDLPYPSGHEDALRAVPRDDGLPPRALVLGATGYLGGRLVPRLLAGGYANREIAAALHLAEGTVKNHVSSLLLKLGVRDRTRAVLRALHLGLLGSPSP